MDEEATTSHQPAKRPKGKRAPRRITNVRCSEQMILSAMMFDVEILLKKFNDLSGVSFYEFGQIFIDQEFPTIFLGRFSIGELVEFSEVLLCYTASYIFSLNDDKVQPSFLHNPLPSDLKKLNPTRRDRPLKERIFGVYLTYCLYYTQPQNNTANIYLSVDQMAELRLFCQRDLLNNQCTEALFCINRLVDQYAFMVTPFEKKFNPMLAHRFDVIDMVSDKLDITESINNESLPALKNIQKDYTLMQTDLIHQRYMAEKNKNKLPSGMDTVKDNLLVKISEIVSKTEKMLDAYD